ncbi:MAG: hypothetical protein KDK53_18215 [Maritimibacter sp.]|nr:hypothetical protein [Maritimibacter sp.]
MSYIDQFEHQLVAVFGGLPIYRPLEPIPGGGHPLDFRCGVDQLVIGGGAGEFPGIVLVDPGGAAADFALEEAESFADDTPLKPLWRRAAAPHAGRDTLDFAGWTRAEIADFAGACAQSLPLLRRYEPDHDGAFARWLSRCLGEFVVYALPEIGLPVTGALPMPPEDPGFLPHLPYGNVLLRPPYRPLLTTTQPFEDDPVWALAPPEPGAVSRRVGESAWAISPFARDPDLPPAVKIVYCGYWTDEDQTA